MDILSVLEILSLIVSAFLAVLLVGNVFYPVLALVFHKNRVNCGKRKLRRYAVMICARNEQNVIGNLIESIKKQDYPMDLVDIYVLADNCTDCTAEVSARYGVDVFVRNDKTQVGKGFALNYLYAKIILNKGDIYDGFFIFDADNLLSSDFIAQMDSEFKGRKTVLTSIRNTKNFADSWISAGYSIGWLFQTGLLNVGRQVFGIPCFVNGTGFLVGAEVLKNMNGWNFFTLTEDCEFTTYCALNGIEINVCSTAEFFDEQPSEFKVSWTQRLRWAKGKYQVFGKYWKDVVKGLLSKKCFVFWDSFSNIFASSLLVLLSAALTFVRLVLEFDDIFSFLEIVFFMCLRSYVSILFLGFLTLILWWKKIRAGGLAKIVLTFFYPLHIMLYIPIALVATFKNVEWTPIRHAVSISVNDLSVSGVDKNQNKTE